MPPEHQHQWLDTDDERWAPREATGVGRAHGTSRTIPFDRWFRYPAGFASDYVELLLDRMSVSEGTVTDCFAGSGVTGTAARNRGLNFTGIEAHPLVAELAALKLDPQPPTPSLLLEDASKVVSATRRRLARTPSTDITNETTLVTRSFTPDVLRQLVEIRGVIRSKKALPTFPYLKWALLATLRDVAAVKVGWPYQRPGVARTPSHGDPLQRFSSRIQAMADDLEGLGAVRTRGLIVNGDSRESAAWSQLGATAQACVSSPPYLNNFDYADATRLELYFWGQVRTWSEMCDVVRSDMVTATTQQSSKPEKLAMTEKLAGAGAVGGKVVALTERLAAVREARAKRSKEYDQVVPAYFVAMWEVLGNLHHNLDPGAPAIWLIGDSAPYGVYIDTPALIGEFAALCGFEVKEDVALRRRGARWATNGTRSQAELSERALVLRRP